MKIKHIILLFSLFFVSNLIYAKSSNLNYAFNDSTNKVEITLKDGTVLKGELIELNLNEVKLKTDLAGIITILQVNVVSIKKISNTPETARPADKVGQIPEEEFYDPKNPNDLNIVKFGGNKYRTRKPDFIPYLASNKYAFSNNYNGLKKNEMLFQNIWVLYNGLDYGISNNFSLGGGLLYLVVGGFANMHVRTQFEISENIKVGAAYNMFFIYGSTLTSNRGSEYFGLLTGGVTIGSKENNLTVSVGQGDYRPSNLSTNNTSKNNGLGLSISGIAKLNSNLYLMTDNFFLKDSDKRFFSLSFRIPGKNNSFDFGLMGNTYKTSYYDYIGSNYVENTTEEFVPYPFLCYILKIK